MIPEEHLKYYMPRVEDLPRLPSGRCTLIEQSKDVGIPKWLLKPRIFGVYQRVTLDGKIELDWR